MKTEKTYLIIGMVVGLLLAVFYFHYFAPRYEMQNTGLSMIKIDKWTGQSWKFAESKWSPVIHIDARSREVDKALHEALQLPYNVESSERALVMLRQKYPALKDLSDEELQERIKVVYSKQILCSLYLENFLKVQNKQIKVEQPIRPLKKAGSDSY